MAEPTAQTKNIIGGKALVKRITTLRAKQTENNKCMICWESEPAYVCTDFRTFVCKDCGNFHTEFGFNVTAIAQAEWTEEDFEHIIKGGNKKAAKEYLAFWNSADFPRPVKGDTVRMRDFVRKAFRMKCWQKQPSAKRLKEEAERTKAAADKESKAIANATAPATNSASAPVVFLARDAACFCSDHDSSAKRSKGEASMKFCGGCKLQLQTNYTSFSYCPGCSAVREMCMICGAPANVQPKTVAPIAPPPVAAITKEIDANTNIGASDTPSQPADATPANNFVDLLDLTAGETVVIPIAAASAECTDASLEELSDFVGAPPVTNPSQTSPYMSDTAGLCLSADADTSMQRATDLFLGREEEGHAANKADTAAGGEEALQVDFFGTEVTEIRLDATSSAKDPNSNAYDPSDQPPHIVPEKMENDFVGGGSAAVSTSAGSGTPRTASVDDESNGGDGTAARLTDAVAPLRAALAASASSCDEDAENPDMAEFTFEALPVRRSETIGPESDTTPAPAVAVAAEHVEAAPATPVEDLPTMEDAPEIKAEAASMVSFLKPTTSVPLDDPFAECSIEPSVAPGIDAGVMPAATASPVRLKDPFADMPAATASPMRLDDPFADMPAATASPIRLDDPFADMRAATASPMRLDDPFAEIGEGTAAQSVTVEAPELIPDAPLSLPLSPRTSCIKSETSAALAAMTVEAVAEVSPAASPVDSEKANNADRFAAFGEIEQAPNPLQQSPQANVLLGRIGSGVQAICWSPEPSTSPQVLPSPAQLDTLDTQHLSQMHMMVTHALQKRAQSSASATPSRSPVQGPTPVQSSDPLSGPWGAVNEETAVSPKKLAFGDVLADFKVKNADWEGTAAQPSASKNMIDNSSCSQSPKDFGSDLFREAFGGAVTSSGGRLSFDNLAALK